MAVVSTISNAQYQTLKLNIQNYTTSRSIIFICSNKRSLPEERFDFSAHESHKERHTYTGRHQVEQGRLKCTNIYVITWLDV